MTSRVFAGFFMGQQSRFHQSRCRCMVFGKLGKRTVMIQQGFTVTDIINTQTFALNDRYDNGSTDTGMNLLAPFANNAVGFRDTIV